MKRLLLIAMALFFGCASIPAIEEEVTKPILPEGCTLSVDGSYSYQSPVDPQVIFKEWIEIEELRQGNHMAMEMFCKNPDLLTNIPVASFLVELGMFGAFALLIDGEPQLFYYNGENDCYEKQVMHPLQIEQFKEAFRKAMAWKKS